MAKRLGFDLDKLARSATAILAEAAEQLQAATSKVELKRDSRIKVYAAGGFSGGLIGDPVDVNLADVDDATFDTVQELVERLQGPKSGLKMDTCVGDFGYYVELGDANAPDNSLRKAFNGGPFTNTPEIVFEIRDILKPYSNGPKP